VWHGPDMGWRLKDVPTRAPSPTPDSALRWPRSFARPTAEMLPRAYRHRPVRPLGP
jgi:hypothetical protein